MPGRARSTIGCERICWPGFVRSGSSRRASSRIERILGSGRALFERQFTAGHCRATVVGGDRRVGATDPAGGAGRGIDGWVAGRAEERSGESELEHDPGGDRQARACSRARTCRSICSRTARRSCSRAWRARAAAAYPSDLRAMPAADQADAAGGVVLVAHRGDHRRARRSADRRRGQDPRARGEPGREGARGRSQAGARQARAAVRAGRAPPSSIPTRPSARRCFRSCPRRRCASWSRRPRPASSCFVSGCARRSAAPTQTTTGGCCPRILDALEFRCANSIYRPVMDALELLRAPCRHARAAAVLPARRACPDRRCASRMSGARRSSTSTAGSSGSRMSCACCARCGTRSADGRSTSSGAHRWRNPDEDMPADFDANRDVHYAAIRKPRDPQAFIADLQARLHAGLDRLDQAVRDEHGRRGADHDPAGAAVDRGPGDGPAAGPAEHPGAARRDPAPTRDARPARRAQGRRPPQRLHRAADLGRLPGDHRSR